MAANVATVVCPLGPRVRSFVGRTDSAVPNKSELLPSPFAEAVDLIRLFRDKTISPHSLVALLGAHTTSQQRAVNATRAGDPQDSTPGVWDVLYYEQTYGSVEAPARVFKFPSDIALAKYAITAREWVTFLGSAGQEHWNKVSDLNLIPTDPSILLRMEEEEKNEDNSEPLTKASRTTQVPTSVSAYSASTTSTSSQSAPESCRHAPWSTRTPTRRAWTSGSRARARPSLPRRSPTGSSLEVLLTSTNSFPAIVPKR